MQNDGDTQDDKEYVITIYHNGVHFEAPMTGKERYLKEKAFLNELTGQFYAPRLLPRPVPDPTGDWYMLNEEQLNAYSAFRKRLGEK